LKRKRPLVGSAFVQATIPVNCADRFAQQE
jgi:hypothetical protein